MYRDLITICAYIYFLDKVSICLHRLFKPSEKLDPNTRWFFIHAFTNMLICKLGWFDLQFCLQNKEYILTIPSHNGNLTIWIAILAHLYHMIFFSGKLTYQDWVHHITMVGISGTLSLSFPSKIIVMGLWFMTGLPGFIDYFNLWCVKMGLMNSLTQKYYYTLISSYIRSPGCMLACFYTLEYLKKPKRSWVYVSVLVNSLLTFWNGQYYSRLACIDYGKKLYIGWSSSSLGYSCVIDNKISKNPANETSETTTEQF